MTGLRVGVIGARRRRQGLGPFVARDLRGAGADVRCFLATSAETRDRGAAELHRIAGIRARGYLDAGEMIAAEKLDAVVILSPHETHAGYLEVAAQAGLHALCEKPLVWGVPDLAAEAARLTAAFDERGLLLQENCLWPYALPAFERLHPGSLDRPPRRFAMQLAPASRGVGMLADSLSHPLSLLQALAPARDPELAQLRFSDTDPDATRLVVGFVYRAGAHDVDVEIDLRHTDTAPRDVRIRIDEHEARRRVSGASYRLSLATDARAVDMDDPLTLLVRDFVAALASPPERDPGERGPGERGRRIVERMALLGDVFSGYRRVAEAM